MRLAAAVIALATLHGLAIADPKAQGKLVYDEGLKYYKAGQYAKAIESWKKAYAIAPSPILLFNIGQAYRLSGDCAQALTFYDDYAREGQATVNQAELDQARALCPKPAAVEPPPVVDTKPPAPPIETKPPPLPPPPPSHAERTAGIAVGAAGLAVGAAAIYFAVDSRSQDKALDHFTGEWTSAQEDIQKRGRRDVALAYTLGAVGAAAAITGSVLFVLGNRSDDHAISIAPTHGGAALVWAHRF